MDYNAAARRPPSNLSIESSAARLRHLPDLSRTQFADFTKTQKYLADSSNLPDYLSGYRQQQVPSETTRVSAFHRTTPRTVDGSMTPSSLVGPYATPQQVPFTTASSLVSSPATEVPMSVGNLQHHLATSCAVSPVHSVHDMIMPVHNHEQHYEQRLQELVQNAPQVPEHVHNYGQDLNYTNRLDVAQTPLGSVHSFDGYNNSYSVLYGKNNAVQNNNIQTDCVQCTQSREDNNLASSDDSKLNCAVHHAINPVPTDRSSIDQSSGQSVMDADGYMDGKGGQGYARSSRKLSNLVSRIL